MSPGAEVASSTIPGLVLRVRPQSDWEDGRKIDVLYKGEHRLVLDAERRRAEQHKARAEQEKARADRLAAQLRRLGIEPSE